MNAEPVASAGRCATHTVFNQPPPLEDWNPLRSDVALVEALRREGAEWAFDRVSSHAQQAGSAAVIQWGFQANENPPKLVTHDRFGHRIDEVSFHPAWHSLLRWSLENEVHSLQWTSGAPGAWAARAAMYMLSAQVDAGHCCTLAMTTACLPALRSTPELANEWIPRLLTPAYDPRSLPPALKRACLVGMAMTEKQGGSDVRTNTTTAAPAGARGAGKVYVLRGHKWFCSAPMCDAFLMLAQAPSGLSCFLVPRITPEGARNGLLLQRLKDKLGNRSNASAEVELDDSMAWLVGEEGRGVATILEMATHTRLDSALISAAMMRAATAQAIHYARHRTAFQKKLVDHDLMQNVLADLSIESEAATVLLMRLAGACERQNESEPERLFRRLVTAAGKYWVCRRAPAHIFEAMESSGGGAYVEESIFPRYYREAPLNSIWEGSGNVMCLDVLRALRTSPAVVGSLLDEIRLAAGADPRLDAAARALEQRLCAASAEPPDAREGLPREGRWLTERIAVVLQASLLVRHAPGQVADAFCASRLSGDGGIAFGTLPPSLDFRSIIDRAFLT